jgi:2-keto-3-deoxy-6-phosphogluconate aldolase
MRPEDILNNAIESIKNGIDKVDNTYESHIREKAIKEVNEKIREKNIDI